MKNKKAIIIAAAVLFTAAAAVSIYAAFHPSTANENPMTSTLNEETLDRDLFPVREGAESEKNIIAENGEEIALKYSYARTLKDGEYQNVYFDSEKNEYRFDDNGNYLGYSKRLSNDEKIHEFEENDTVYTARDDEKMIVNTAEEYLKAFYSSRFEGMKFYSIKSNSDRYIVSFGKLYGKDGFACGSNCFVEIAADGTVMQSNISDGEKFDEFNGELYSNTTQDEVKTYVEDSANEMFSELGLKEIEISGIAARVIDGKSVLSVQAVLKTEQCPSEEEINKYDLKISYSTEPQFACRFYYDLNEKSLID